MELSEVKKVAQSDLDGIVDLRALENWRVKYTGRKSMLSLFLRSLAGKPIEERRRLGPLANSLRQELETLFFRKKQELEQNTQSGSGFDVTEPGTKYEIGHLHPLTIVSRQILDIFRSMGFDIATGPEIESEYYNFSALNIPDWHPARETMDTLWLDLPELKKDLPEKGYVHTPDSDGNGVKYPKGNRFLLRTHTSPIQVRYMQTHQPPFRMVVGDGRVYRNEATDARHEFQLHQLEGLMIGQNVSMATLHYIVREFFNKFFNQEVKLRLTPDFFPFVEPGAAVAVSCISCNGHDQSCKLCTGTGWFEVAGAGMVHPNVLKESGIDPKKWQGFAFGFGIDRLAMVKYDIKDIRLFMSGDLRFIRQF
jgi:phenylalanyl-tRNA synthetase alpha chain